MQILHNGHNHWLVNSSVGSRKSSEVYIYDSMYCNTTSEVQKVVAALPFTNESHITSNLWSEERERDELVSNHIQLSAPAG